MPESTSRHFTPRFQDEGLALYHGKSEIVLTDIPDNSVSSVVTDPPYEIGFMGKSWDAAGIAYSVPLWQEVLRVLKPGGYLLSFGGCRTYHRMTCAIEDAGFEIRDCIMYTFGSGFPKSHNAALGIDKMLGSANRGRAIPTASTYQASDTNEQNKLTSNPVGPYVAQNPESEPWMGFGTNLKPAYEPVVMARKPLVGTVAQNLLAHGTGALNIDACRIGGEPVPVNRLESWSGFGEVERPNYVQTMNTKGRWPANLILSHHEECIQTGTRVVKGDQRDTGTGSRPSGFGDVGAESGAGEPNAPVYGNESVPIYECVPGCPVAELDKQSGHLKSGDVAPGGFTGPYTAAIYGQYAQNQIRPEVVYADEGGASRFFYCSKASKAERNLGLPPDAPENVADDGRSVVCDNPYQRGATLRKNNHPSVKPLDLVRYLIRLVTPPGGVVLDPFAGSGTTLIAAFQEKFSCIGIEQSEEYCDLISQRLKGVIAMTAPTLF